MFLKKDSITYEINFEILTWWMRRSVVGCSGRRISDVVEADFRNGVGSIPVGVNNLSIAGWIMWSTVIQYTERSLTKYWDLTGDLTMNRDSKLG